MIRRVLVSLAALAVGAVALDPIGEVLFYGLEGFPVSADASGVLRILSATGSVALLAVGAAAGCRVPGRAGGWPTVAAGLVVAGLLTAYAPLDGSSALFGELHPLIRPVAALVGGVVIGATLAAVLPATPAGGDPWPVAAFAAGIVAGLPLVLRLPPDFPELRTLGWAEVIALGLAVVAAVATRTAQEPETPRIRAVTLVAVFGAIVGAAFHMEYVGRATESSPAAVVAVVLLLTVLVWVLISRVLVRWSGSVAGPDAARFALTCAGAAAALFSASGRNHGIGWGSDWLPLIGLLAAAAGAWLTRRRPAIPWDAAGIGAAALIALVITTVRTENSSFLIAGMPVAAFALGSALARTAVAGALCGLVTLLITAPVLIGTFSQLQNLLFDDNEDQSGWFREAVLLTPLWLTGLLTAAYLARRPRPTSPAPEPLPVG
ncbi:hypothetical protein DFJ67_4585 [Asanoa ferruginea]|uniref:Uncharacterized protein n=1 Tax=Asanoa ferruginea TaxID=53367 RepID=A0A3D9ZMY6_9ACTN|nr:hypothetical protein [Asanoa ferruginea]REF98567.1 hypothetical protein DFJ67_4585 [Asanoa ferruginea]GIF53502.1 hypothetical protein Afe04nite_80410 [Asanoa ferruginea]